MRITVLDFGSFLSYSPHGASPDIDQAREVMKIMKADQYLEKPQILMSDWIAKTIKQHLDRLPFASLFKENTILVPTPGSSLMQANSLWVPHRIATALVNVGIGKKVVACLVRKTAVRKSAWSKPSERPKVKEHIASFSVQELISSPPPEEIVLIDDIITRGATLLAAANRLSDALPKARIRAFAAMRSIGNSSDFVSLSRPVTGTVQYRPLKDDTIRRP